MATENITVGWGSVSRVFGIPVLANGGDVSLSKTPTYHNSIDIGSLSDNSSRVKAIVADGTIVRQGNLSFDCDNDTLPSIINNIKNRKDLFSVSLGTDDFKYYTVSDCAWTSLSLSASANALPTCSIAFLAKTVDDEYSPQSNSGININDRELVPYWQTGNQDVLSWTISINQSVQPIYLNEATCYPAYFRFGTWDISLQIETIANYREHKELQVCLGKLFEITKGTRIASSFTKASNNEPAHFSYSYNAHGRGALSSLPIRDSVFTL